MANHKSAIKRIRSNDAKAERNHYHAKSTRTAIKKLRNVATKPEGEELFKTVASMLDKLAKKNIIHKKNASNKKSSLAKFVAALK